MKLSYPYNRIVAITQKFNNNLVGYYKDNGLTGHTGWDFVGRHRENIYAATDGYVYSHMNKGNPDLMKFRAVYQIVEEEGLAYEVCYGHLMDIYVEPGTFVKKGTLLGTQGNTGNVFMGGAEVTAEQKKNDSPAGSHCHFQVRLLKPVTTKPSGYYIRDMNLKPLLYNGHYFEIPYYNNGVNGCIDIEPFFTYQPATSLVQKLVEVLSPKLTQTLRFGSRGSQVKLLQKKLGFSTQDGIFGTRTEDVLKHYQATHNLTPDGICGPLTRAKLNEI